MRIVDVRTFLMQAGAPDDSAWASDGGGHQRSARNWLFVKVETDEGVVGVGECSGWPRVTEVAVRDLAHVIVGEDPADIERLWQRLYVAQMGHGLTGVIGSGAISGIDMALWDIKGKVLGTPVWNLLGGLVRERVRVYAHAANGPRARELARAGIEAVKTGGVAAPLQKVHEIRQAVGDDVDVMVDLHGPPWMTAKDAIVLGRALEPYNLAFVEDPVTPEDVDGLSEFSRQVAIPLAAGERHGTLWGWRELIQRGGVDVIQPDTGRAGGITQMKKLAGLAEAHNVLVAPHSGSLGPVAEFAAVHLLAAVPNAMMLERVENDWSGRTEVTDVSLRVVDGHIEVPRTPGLGVEINEDVIAQYPSTRNVAVAKGGWEPGTETETVYVQARLRRGRCFGGIQDRGGPVG